jgi:hypothetical protein
VNEYQPPGSSTYGSHQGSPPEIEFGPEQDQSFSKLAGSMRFVGIAYMILGGLGALGSLCSLAKDPVQGATAMITNVALLLQGFWANNAAQGFSNVVATSGNDITNLMAALAQLRKFYVVMIVVGVVTMAVSALTLAFPHRPRAAALGATQPSQTQAPRDGVTAPRGDDR